MNFKKERLLVISLALSLLIHALLFSSFFLLKPKPKEEKEKIITVSLDEDFKKEFKPPVEEKKMIQKNEALPQTKSLPKVEEKKIVQQKETLPPPQPAPKPQPEKPKPIVKPESETPKQEAQKPQEKQNTQQPIKQNPPQTQPTQQTQPTTAQTQKTEPTPIDLSKGRPDQFKQPEKKEEDIDGYLKELIRYLNQQARERDLYPPIAKRLKIEGQVIVRVTINEDGTIDENSIKIVESSGYNVLDRGAIEILKKLQPYKKPPKRITVEIPIVFQIIYM
ncbi:MAG TPA: energy transducer TonB [Sulfurihydrogenibium sp.]|uniref:TonB family protein n=1 Tax=Sulfurihydrogenibium sp. (strain YO3AOP1) TaxID=436114 RepID=UPI0001724A47|nr:energy transducer TonB [Sulfurihydrogenibium sp. YO3AOP1]ACD66975.1 TonB family protein [Sulfurihydrogenibium sp. YO3AOP1]HBT99429.1 energy transducer TonB [Sulfurihydrogenibium sp.]